MFVPRILFTFASRSRPGYFYQGLDNLIEMCQDKEHYTIFAQLDLDDPYYEDYRARIGEPQYNKVIFDFGHSKSKIDAINRKFPDWVEWDILINWSDDQKAILFGFDALIKQWFYSVFPEGDGFLHCSDQDAKNAVPVLYVADKKYYSRDGYIYHPSYQSLWADNEGQLVAQLRGRYHFIGDIVYHHLNPAYGHRERDELFDRQQGLWNVDEENFNNRKAINFGL